MPALPHPLLIRWTAYCTYRTATGPLQVTHDLPELADLHDLIERGPHWDTLIEIKIVKHKPNQPLLTVEEARLQ
jgi:hypothetical protein